MSKLLGKLLCKELEIDDESGFGVGSCSVKYIHSSDSFEFKWEGTRNGIGGIFKVCKDFAMCVAGISNTFNWMYEWSVGYKTLVHLSDISLLRRRELNYVASCLVPDFKFGSNDEGMDNSFVGRRTLLVTGWLDNDSDFDNLCMVQHLFNVSPTILNSVVVAWKRKKWGRTSSRWVLLKKRENFGGRIVGAKGLNNSDFDLEFESDDEFEARISHNKKAAIEKGFLAWYLDACREECKRKGIVFDKDKCVREWNKMRESACSCIDF